MATLSLIITTSSASDQGFQSAVVSIYSLKRDISIIRSIFSEGELAVQPGFSLHLTHPVTETARTAADLRFPRGHGCFQHAERNCV
jgi:hypothetical protein